MGCFWTILALFFFSIASAQNNVASNVTNGTITPIERQIQQSARQCTGLSPSEINDTSSQLQSQVVPQIKEILGHPGLYASNPATSCLNLIHGHPEVPPGYYWIKGQDDIVVKTYCNFYGFSYEYPAASCNAIKSNIGASSGYYWLQAENSTASGVYCNMEKICCGAGNGTGWIQLYNLDMTESTQICPEGLYTFERNTAPYRTCRRVNTAGSCTSFNFSTGGVPYSKLCGRMKGYQIGSPDAFNNGLDFGVANWLFDGVHIYSGTEFVWGFVIALSTKYDNSLDECPCSNIYNSQNDYLQNNIIPDWLKSSYFCESGTSGDYSLGTFFADDPVWDGQNCPSWSTCCTLNGTPQFCKTLLQSTIEDVQINVCFNQDSYDEDVGIEMIELYAQ